MATATRRKSKLRERSDEELQRRLEDVVSFTDILDEVQVEWWLAGGSSLGGRRTGDFIPWDWDVELHCRTDDALPHAKQIRRRLKQERFEINTRLTKPVRAGFKIAAKRPGGTRIGLLGYIRNGDMMVRAAPSEARSPHGLTIPASMFADGSTVTIRGVQFPTHHPVDDWLEWSYGPDWQIPKKLAKRNEYLTPQMRGVT